MNSELYHFKSPRLGFRIWQESDLSGLDSINSNPLVMKHFPSIVSRSETEAFMLRMNQQYLDRSYCYFAVDILETIEFIGFIGLSYQDYQSPFTPCVDIGWRLDPEFWARGLATEGALRCLEYGFQSIGLQSIRSIAPVRNIASISVMEKCGMLLKGTFNHPGLKDYPDLEQCVCYEIIAQNY